MDDLARRLRAARAYARLSQPAMAERLGMSARTLKGIELGTRGLSPVERRGLIDQAAEVTGLPAAFFTADFAQLEKVGPPLDERLSEMERLLLRIDAALERDGKVSR